MRRLKRSIRKIFHLLLSPLVWRDFFRFRSVDKTGRFSSDFLDFYPKLLDKTVNTGFDRHYVYHTSWAARKLKEIAPEKHIDVSSSLYFAGIVSAFMPVEFYDYRPPALALDGLEVRRADLMSLPFPDGSVRSLSCMHTVEHIGLGRYGDEIDPDGDLKAIEELKRVLAPGGSLLFAVPVGRPKIMFNAHRIYSYDQIAGYFSGLDLKEFCLIPESSAGGGLVVDNARAMADREEYGCGCFWFVKK